MKLPFFSEPRIVYLTIVKDNQIMQFQTIAHGVQEALKNVYSHNGWNLPEDTDIDLNSWGTHSLPDVHSEIIIGGGKMIPSERDKDHPEALEAIKTWEEV
tara:strand:- start:1945 stop:2244 length:300 start_codon:yes stop_codon:yes gene_type:complete